MRRSRWADDRGETLVELLVAMLIMGTAVVAVVGGLGTAIMMSDIHRKQAVIDAKLSEYAAVISNGAATTPGYLDCADPADFPSFDPGAGYGVDPVQVGYWNGSNDFVATCGTDTGVQRVRLGIHSTDARVDRTMDVILRRPCRPTDPPCG